MVAERLTLPTRGLAGVVLVGLVWLGSGAWRPAARAVVERLGPVEAVHEDDLAVTVTGVVAVGRRERLVVAPVAGLVEKVAAEGESVPAGAVLARLSPVMGGRAVAVRAPFAGVVSYFADGQEQKHGPEAALVAPQPAGDEAPLRPLVQDRPVSAGQPIVRVVDRTELRTVFWYKAGDRVEEGVGALSRGRGVELLLPGEPIGIGAQVLEVKGAGQWVRVQLRVEREPANWLYRRSIHGARLVIRRAYGQVVPSSALVRTAQGYAVWVSTPQGAVRIPVEVVGKVGHRVAVRGIPQGARVYRWPRWLARW